MISIYKPKELDINVYKEMHSILIENQYITYPDYQDKEEYFDMWVKNLKAEEDYNIILYKEDERILGFLNFGTINGENWIAEIQVKDDFKNTGITTRLLKAYVDYNKDKNIDIIIAHINPNNELSQKVFLGHVGFKPIEDRKNKYYIKYETLVNYLNK